MSEPACTGIAEALNALDQIAPNVPLLALGQTIFWDEPLKAGVALELSRRGQKPLVAGVHDTDYFAKLPGGTALAAKSTRKFVSLPHNDTNTRGLWSAAAEFSSLFGSETVVSQETLQSAGLRLSMVDRERPDLLTEATEAFGWRGVVSLDEAPPIAADLPLRDLFPVLVDSLDWAIGASLSSLAGDSKTMAEERGNQLHRILCDLDELPSKFSHLYRQLLPEVYSFVANEPVPITATATTELLRFNRETVHQPRFELLDLFLRPDTRQTARAAYDEAIQGGSGQYELARFGTGAIPFDLVIPGKGRGTVRLGNRGIVIMTKVPQFISIKRPVANVQEFAALVEDKFGPNCALIGKAVTLIGLLAREFSFVFHEGASSYVKHSRKLHQILAAAGYPLTMNPILRIRYEAWDALTATCAWFKLPEPLRRPFGTEELCSPSFAQRWRQVGQEQRELLYTFAKLRRPVDLIEFLDRQQGGSWRALADEYRDLRRELDQMQAELRVIRQEREHLYGERRALRAARVRAENALGAQWRAEIFERDATPEALDRREQLLKDREDVLRAMTENTAAFAALRSRQNALVQRESVQAVHARRKQIELEAELKRMRMIREAVIASKGLDSANFRPAAWWFPLVSPDGRWFRETVRAARAYLEPLS